MWSRSQSPIILANGQIEVVTNQTLEGDKNSTFCQFHLLRYDAGGNLLRDTPSQFTYNRQLVFRCPLFDEQRKITGILSVVARISKTSGVDSPSPGDSSSRI